MMSASVENPPDCLMWSDALAAKYDGVGTFGREQWDQLFGHCQAICDWPCVAFAKELIEAYPEAKVLITTREVDSWHSSTMKTVHWRATEPELQLAAKVDWAASMYQPMISSTFYVYEIWTSDTFANYEQQNSGPNSGKATSKRTANAASRNTTPKSAPSSHRRTSWSTRWARAGNPSANSSTSQCLRARSSHAPTTPMASWSAAARGTACRCSMVSSATPSMVALLRL